MDGITLAKAQENLSIWIAADLAVASGQSYSISTGVGSRSLTRVNADLITEKIEFWENKVERLSRKNKGVRIIAVTPIG